MILYIRIRMDLYMQVTRKGLGFGSISSAWDVVYRKPRDMYNIKFKYITETLFYIPIFRLVL